MLAAIITPPFMANLIIPHLLKCLLCKQCSDQIYLWIKIYQRSKCLFKIIIAILTIFLFYCAIVNNFFSHNTQKNLILLYPIQLPQINLTPIFTGWKLDCYHQLKLNPPNNLSSTHLQIPLFQKNHYNLSTNRPLLYLLMVYFY